MMCLEYRSFAAAITLFPGRENSRITSRPPGRKTLRNSAMAIFGSCTFRSPKAMDTISAESSGIANRIASPSRYSTPPPFEHAIASISGVKSTPITDPTPASANNRAKSPVPHATSTTASLSRGAAIATAARRHR